MAKRHTHEIIVGNVGTVHSGKKQDEAYKAFQEYVEISKQGQGRAGNEPVTWMRDGEPYLEYEPINPHLLTWRQVAAAIEKMKPVEKDMTARFYLPTEDGGPVDVAFRYFCEDMVLKPNKVDGPVARLVETDNF